ncbi:ATPase [Alsobacter soli]|uniref:ATPase n=1 Tax=Alsobacter soli TaxID=2109933 RepID=A0A2T1HSD2_9HYPH|nr:DUF6456 domain-containing protein [Alsobacter soli]PSC04552.1 ATPase [Alsobacter soli]
MPKTASAMKRARRPAQSAAAAPGALPPVLARQLRALRAGPVAVGPDAPEAVRHAAALLVRMDLAAWEAATGRLALTEAGRARLRREDAAPDQAWLAQHKPLGRAQLDREGESRAVTVDEAESPLAWLRRRAGKDGRPFLGDAQFQAGERFRVDLTLGMVLPSVTASWSPAPRGGRRGGGVEHVTDMALAARQRCDAAARALGAELAGLLVDVCGFLKGLEQVERERGWPARSAKVVLRIALDRLAAHYGLAREAVGPDRSPMRMWGAPDYRPTMDG